MISVNLKLMFDINLNFYSKTILLRLWKNTLIKYPSFLLSTNPKKNIVGKNLFPFHIFVLNWKEKGWKWILSCRLLWKGRWRTLKMKLNEKKFNFRKSFQSSQWKNTEIKLFRIKRHKKPNSLEDIISWYWLDQKSIFQQNNFHLILFRSPAVPNMS